LRLDNHIHSKGFVDSRNKAQTLIKESKVKVDGEFVTKPSFKIEDDMKIEILEEKIYVSRSAEKLKLFLETSSLDIKNLDALDIGASTGGFTEVLLEYGAKSVTAIDVGTAQLNEKIKDDNRVTSIENMDIREFKSKPFPLIVCDVSFISLQDIISSIDTISNGDIILLFKPQFEVGKDAKRDRNGVVKSDTDIWRSRDLFEKATFSLGWDLIRVEESKKRGKEGNIEFFYHFRKSN